MKELIIELVEENLRLKKQIDILKEQMESKDEGQIWESKDGTTTFNLTDGVIVVNPQIPGTRYKVGSKDEYTVYDGESKFQARIREMMEKQRAENR